MTDNKKRVVAAERDSIIAWIRILDAMVKARDQDERTARRVKNGLRDYRLLIATMKRLVGNINASIPEEQKAQVRKQAEMTRLLMTIGGPVGKQSDDLWVLDTQDAVNLIILASKGECMLCDGDRKNCFLSRMIDELPVAISDSFRVSCKGGI